METEQSESLPEQPAKPVRTPTPKRGLRHDKRTREALIAEFKRVGRVDLACAAAGCSRDSHYEWLKTIPEYADAFAEAEKQAIGLLEDEAHRRAYRGTMKPINVGGKVVYIVEFSDRLMEFILKARAPEKYGDRRELTHKGDLTVKRLVGVSEEDI